MPHGHGGYQLVAYINECIDRGGGGSLLRKMELCAVSVFISALTCFHLSIFL